MAKGKPSQVGCFFFMILLSFLALEEAVVFGARVVLLQDQKLLQQQDDHPQKRGVVDMGSDRRTSTFDPAPSSDYGDGGYFTTINREVPSSPDPLHNRGSIPVLHSNLLTSEIKEIIFGGADEKTDKGSSLFDQAASIFSSLNRFMKVISR